MTERYVGRKPSPNAPSEVQQKYREKLEKNLIYYHKRYENDDKFRQSEIDRNKKRINEEYKNDPEVRERMKTNALQRYYRLKAEQAAARS